MHSTKPQVLIQDNRTFDVLFFSPHLDDAVLSAGNLLASYINQGKNAAVITMFTAGDDSVSSLSIRSFLRQCSQKTSSQLFEQRKKEDIYALGVFGNVFIAHLGFIDGLFRFTVSTKPGQSTPVYPSFREIFDGKISSKDTSMYTKLISQIRHISQRHCNTSTRIYAPLGAGDHVDHIIVHNAIRQVFTQSVSFWEDIPYRSEPTRIFSRLSDLEQAGLSLRPVVRDSHELARIKKQAVHLYKSQLPGLLANGLSDIDYLHEVFYEQH